MRPRPARRTRPGCFGSRFRSPIAPAAGRPSSSSFASRRERDRLRPPAAAGAAAEGDRRLPGVDDAARRRPRALGQADRRRRSRASDARPVHGRNKEADPPGWNDLYRVGTVAVVHKMIKVPDGTLRILVQGVQRVRLVEPVEDEPYLVAELEDLPEIVPESAEVEALTRTVQQQFAQIIGMTPYLPEELQLAAANIDDPTALTHLIASTLRLKTDERQELLETADVEERCAGSRRSSGARSRCRTRLEDPIAGRERDRQNPARPLPPSAAEGDPGGARRGRRPSGRDQRAARAARGQGPARARRQGSHT